MKQMYVEEKVNVCFEEGIKEYENKLLIQVSRFNDVCIRRSLSLSREPEEAEKA
jgi:hypothetical protein